MCLQRSIASVSALAIQKRHFVDHLLVWRQVDRRSGVFCVFVHILLLIIVRLHEFSDNTRFNICIRISKGSTLFEFKCNEYFKAIYQATSFRK